MRVFRIVLIVICSVFISIFICGAIMGIFDVGLGKGDYEVLFFVLFTALTIGISYPLLKYLKLLKKDSGKTVEKKKFESTEETENKVSAVNKNYINELRELAELKEKGIITEEEFQQKKETILSESSESITDSEFVESIQSQTEESEVLEKEGLKKKDNSKNLKIIFGGVGLVFLLWIFGVFDSGGSSGKGVGKGVHSDVTEHRLQGSTVYATAYVGYGINAEYCARGVMSVAHSLMTNKYKNASSLVLKYGIDYTNKYGEEKKKLIGTFKPNMSKLRRYKTSTKYSFGELGDGAKIMREFQGAGFR